jgi:hypothetical protein
MLVLRPSQVSRAPRYPKRTCTTVAFNPFTILVPFQRQFIISCLGKVAGPLRSHCLRMSTMSWPEQESRLSSTAVFKHFVWPFTRHLEVWRSSVHSTNKQSPCASLHNVKQSPSRGEKPSSPKITSPAQFPTTRTTAQSEFNVTPVGTRGHEPARCIRQPGLLQGFNAASSGHHSPKLQTAPFMSLEAQSVTARHRY